MNVILNFNSKKIYKKYIKIIEDFIYIYIYIYIYVYIYIYIYIYIYVSVKVRVYWFRDDHLRQEVKVMSTKVLGYTL